MSTERYIVIDAERRTRGGIDVGTRRTLARITARLPEGWTLLPAGVGP